MWVAALLDDEVLGVDRLRNGTIPKRAIVDLLKAIAAKPT